MGTRGIEMNLLHQQFEFSGCKIALIYDNHLLTILRDNKPEIPFPNMWEIPGGGREGDETPSDCVSRELYEELGILITAEQIIWSKCYPGILNPDKTSIFMVGHLLKKQVDQIVLGDEGQGYQFMPINQFLTDKTVIQPFQNRFRDYLDNHIENSQ